ncbi:hypothetical protein [Fuchsiella alkaliacetigena]|uniref:hypothetical protein n=1 Tax=Fuchsiella alkaliacetigena TaxID=957042 RepID=UPI00200A8B2A|nr:hypothetical protein [Fuchsiella alkaliacetigena]MCK8826005.1 hypothetical protein [Fuchsiella alkaliacetigena]
MNKGFNPVEMCQRMTESTGKAMEIASYATPEVRALFEDWVEAIEEEIIKIIKEESNTENLKPDQIAKRLKISEKSVNFFIAKLAQQGELKITGIELVNK